MEINTAAYVGSFPSESKSPKDGKPEFAFIGRSNVGKSSLINMLCDRKAMAHVSKKPGKTQALNFYLIDGSWYIVDLPGYGYAKISKRKRQEWRKMIEGYLVKRNTLQCAFILLDANIPPQQIDIDFINWMGEARVPFVIIYTKADRLKPQELEANILAIQTKLQESWNDLPQQFTSAAHKRIGREEILGFIEEVNARTMK